MNQTPIEGFRVPVQDEDGSTLSLLSDNSSVRRVEKDILKLEQEMLQLARRDSMRRGKSVRSRISAYTDISDLQNEVDKLEGYERSLSKQISLVQPVERNTLEYLLAEGKSRQDASKMGRMENYDEVKGSNIWRREHGRSKRLSDVSDLSFEMESATLSSGREKKSSAGLQARILEVNAKSKINRANLASNEVDDIKAFTNELFNIWKGNGRLETESHIQRVLEDKCKPLKRHKIHNSKFYRIRTQFSSIIKTG